MKSTKLLFIFFLLLSFLGCKEEQKVEYQQPTSVTTFYFIRHAEKDRFDPDNPDPELSQEGLGRAMHWAEVLNEVPLDAIYTTDYQRTAMTAAPTAVKRELIEEFYDPGTWDAAQFKKDNLNKSVLVVGHSNTTPQMVNSLIGEEKYAEMDEYDNGSLFIVQLVNDVATSQRLVFNCNCPAR
ncbi:MAG: histidine phosphatase family protein [Flavobacteriaceae bacterium]